MYRPIHADSRMITSQNIIVLITVCIQLRRMVMVGNDCMVRGRCEFTIAYHEAAPNLMHHVAGRFRRLPNVTKIYARGAKPIGDFGLVYQRLPICLSGSNPAADRLYQAPPPGNSNGYYTLLYVLTMVGYEAVPIYFTFGIGLIVFGLCE